MDENIIKINLVEVADELATRALLKKHDCNIEEELMIEVEPGCLFWKEGIQDDYNELYDYYYNVIYELKLNN